MRPALGVASKIDTTCELLSCRGLFLNYLFCKNLSPPFPMGNTWPLRGQRFQMSQMLKVDFVEAGTVFWPVFASQGEQ